jgi:glycosyltransferase involved in cell wall biosynthesis
MISVIKKISVVIPVFRNEPSLKITYELLNKLFQSELSNYVLEVIFVNDGSDDRSLQILKDLNHQDKRIKVISFTRNFGQVHAVSAGYLYSSGDYIVLISADLQDPVDLIISMIKNCEAGADVAICYRIDRGDSFFSKIFSKVAYSIIRLSTPEIPVGGFDYLMLSRRALNTLNNFGSKTRFYPSDILWCGFQVSMIPYKRVKRIYGKTQYTFWKKFKILLDAIFDTSYWPIRIISLIGLFVSLMGFLFALLVIYAWLNQQTPFSGYAPIIISILVVGGIQIILLGIIGEYIWRIYDEVRKKPGYIIDKIFE